MFPNRNPCTLKYIGKRGTYTVETGYSGLGFRVCGMQMRMETITFIGDYMDHYKGPFLHSWLARGQLEAPWWMG